MPIEPRSGAQKIWGHVMKDGESTPLMVHSNLNFFQILTPLGLDCVSHIKV